VHQTQHRAPIRASYGNRSARGGRTAPVFREATDETENLAAAPGPSALRLALLSSLPAWVPWRGSRLVARLLLITKSALSSTKYQRHCLLLASCAKCAVGFGFGFWVWVLGSSLRSRPATATVSLPATSRTQQQQRRGRGGGGGLVGATTCPTCHWPLVPDIHAYFERDRGGALGLRFWVLLAVAPRQQQQLRWS
jgi:hypothetical protein